MAQPTRFRLVTKTTHLGDALGRRYIAQQFEPNMWWVGRVDAREWLRKDVSWQQVLKAVQGQQSLF